MNAKFEISKSEKNNQFYFVLKAKNGKIVLQSEGYTTEKNCKDTIKAIQKIAGAAVIVKI
jgi:uncharacterized protein YegP (UPF0339 family)